MPQVQIIVVGTHHEVVVVFRGLADGAAVQNGLLVDGAVRSLVGRHVELTAANSARWASDSSRYCTCASCTAS